MKLFYTIAIATLCICFKPAVAQRYAFELAVEGGPGFANIYGPAAKQIKNQQSLLAYQAGIGLRFNTPKVVGIYTGIYVTRKGFDWPLKTTSRRDEEVTYHYKLMYNYVTVPVMVNITVGKKVQFFINAGGYVSGLFKIHLQQKELGLNYVNPGGYQYVDAGFCGGLGLRVPVLKRLIISLEACNSTGFLTVTKKPLKDEAFYNTSTCVMVGLAYSFKPWKEKKKVNKGLFSKTYFGLPYL
jgi:hypothetical protein